MDIKIRNYRGAERADLVLEPIALLAGKNGQGKSSIAQCVAAALTRNAIVIPGVTKKDGKKLVRDGADEGGVLVEHEGVTLTVSYPKCEVHGGQDTRLTVSELAAGLGHVFDMKADDRARVLAGYIQAIPTEDDVIAAVLDIGFSETTAGRVWESVKAGTSTAWDLTWTKTREYGTKQKGVWESITGEAYGSKKAADWKPALLLGATERSILVDAVNAAKQRVDDIVGGVAVSEAEIARLAQQVKDAELAEDVAIVKTELEQVREQLAAKRAARAAMPSETGVQTKNQITPCPACNTPLVVEKVYNEPVKLSKHDPEAEKLAATHDNRKERAKLDGTIEGLKSAIATLEGRHERAKRLIDDGIAASVRLQEIGENTGVGQDAVDAARVRLGVATATLKAFDDKAKADELHVTISKNDKLIEVLAPDGLRRKALAKALDSFNARLAALSTTAGWPSVGLDHALSPHYGARPVGAVSKSEQFRARVIFQIALAQLDQSAAVVIDDAETMIDASSRSGLLLALQNAGLRALVCMAFAKRDLVPDLKAAGLGHSYWVEGGVAAPV